MCTVHETAHVPAPPPRGRGARKERHEQHTPETARRRHAHEASRLGCTGGDPTHADRRSSLLHARVREPGDSAVFRVGEHPSHRSVGVTVAFSSYVLSLHPVRPPTRPRDPWTRTDRPGSSGISPRSHSVLRRARGRIRPRRGGPAGQLFVAPAGRHHGDPRSERSGAGPARLTSRTSRGEERRRLVSGASRLRSSRQEAPEHRDRRGWRSRAVASLRSEPRRRCAARGGRTRW